MSELPGSGSSGWKFGLEAEYALIRPDGRFADYTNTEWAEVQPFIDSLPDHRHSELRVGDAGIRVKNWYVEGDERFDEDGRSTGLAFKGVEVRTPACASIDAAMASLRDLRAPLAATLRAGGWSLTAIGFNPCTATYAPDYGPWERAFHASHVENALPEVSTLSYGPDLNLSFAGDTPERALGRARRLTHYSPWIVPFAFNAPLVGGNLWEGLSYRTFRRTGARPAALVHLSSGPSHPLVKRADPLSQHLRVEFKAFDMVGDDRLLAELFRLLWGIALADPALLPGADDLPDAALHRQVALSGFDDERVRGAARWILAAAAEALHEAGDGRGFPLLEAMLDTRRTPAHAARERYRETGRLFEPLAAV